MQIKKFRHTPLSAAQAMRSAFESQIAKTWDDYEAEHRQSPFTGPFLNSYQFGKLVQEQAGCTFQEAFEALVIVAPELFAEYWMELGRDEYECVFIESVDRGFCYQCGKTRLEHEKPSPSQMLDAAMDSMKRNGLLPQPTAVKPITIRGCRLMKKGIKAPDGRYVPAWYSRGALNSTGEMAITIYAKSILKGIPSELGNVENGSDMQTDYFEADRIRFLEGSQEYAALIPFAVGAAQ